MTRKEPIMKGRVMQHGSALGTVTPEMIEKRAREIALISGRSPDHFNQNDWDEARRELLGTDTDAESVDNAEEAMETSPQNSNPGSMGHRPEGQEVDDEQTVTERLVHQGVEEAQHDEMVQGTRASLRRETK